MHNYSNELFMNKIKYKLYTLNYDSTNEIIRFANTYFNYLNNNMRKFFLDELKKHGYKNFDKLKKNIDFPFDKTNALEYVIYENDWDIIGLYISSQIVENLEKEKRNNIKVNLLTEIYIDRYNKYNSCLVFKRRNKVI